MRCTVGNREFASKEAVELPFSRRHQITIAGDKLTIQATLVSVSEVDKIIRILDVNKTLLGDPDDLAE